MKPSKFLRSSIKDYIINLQDDYRYLKTGYYVSMHAEVLGNAVIPSSENIIDANRTPILLLKAAKAGIPTVPHLVTDSIRRIMSEFDFPLVLFAVNPFSYDGYFTVRNRSGLYRAVKSLSMNYKFAVCVQPLRGRMFSFKSFFGRCEENSASVKAIAARVFDAFSIPLCKLYAQCVDETAFLCNLQPLKKDEISQSETKIVSEEVCRFLAKGEQLVE